MTLMLERPLRDAYLEQLRRVDPEFVRQVRGMLARYEGGAGEDITDAAEPVSVVGTPSRIGPYRVLHRIGQGGMGQVFLAERADGEIERQVAIKVIGFGFDLPIVHQRFLSERQILAGFDHPYIARLFDAGTTADGRPYLVMEAVDGRPIDRYCAEERLSLEERLRLFRKVCSAVEHAHRRLVVHRDLKPPNILVTADGTPKLLDFGIAKLLDPDSFPLPLDEVTRTALRPLTPRWASPEQVCGGTITTASDVWSLGVLLHRLLTGGHPHDPVTTAPEALLAAMQRPPERASRCLQRRLAEGKEVPWPDAEARRVARRLDGDLDSILTKALRFEPDERYPSVSALDDDLRRLLDGEPVRASRATRLYRLGKFFRRHRTAVLVAASVLLLVVGFAGVSLYQSAEIRAQVERAELQAARAEQTRDFLADLLGAADERMRREGEVTLAELLEEGVGRVPPNGQVDPVVRFQLLLMFSKGQFSIESGASGAMAFLDALSTKDMDCSDVESELVGLADYALDSALESDERLGQRVLDAIAEFGCSDNASYLEMKRRVALLLGQAEAPGWSNLELTHDLEYRLGKLGQFLLNRGFLFEALLVQQRGIGSFCTQRKQRHKHCSNRLFESGFLLGLVGQLGACYLASEQSFERLPVTLHQHSTNTVVRKLQLGSCQQGVDTSPALADADLLSAGALEVDRRNLRARYHLGLSQLYRAIVYERNGELDRRNEALALALERLEPLSRESQVVFIDNAYAMALLMADRIDEARPLVAQLLEGGWRRPDFMRLATAKGALPDPMPPTPRLEDVVAPEVMEWIESLPTGPVDDPEIQAVIDALDEAIAELREQELLALEASPAMLASMEAPPRGASRRP
ncbi:MAG: serine/threonine-protein kinase [Acidobacteriota bacterium]